MAEKITIRELVVKLLFEGEESGITKFNQALQALKVVAHMAEVAVKALSDVVIGTSLEIAREGDAVAKHSKQSGLSVEMYDSLTNSIHFAGGETADLEVGIRTLTKNVEAFVRTGKGEGAPAFKTFLGPDAQKILGSMDQIGDALPLIADGFTQIEDPIKRAAMLQLMFGRSAGKLIPLLQGGSEGLRDLAKDSKNAGIFSKELAHSSELLQDNLLRLSLRWHGLKLAIGEQTVPALVDLTDELVKTADSLKKLFLPEIQAAAKFLADSFRSLRDWLKSFREEILQSEKALAILRIGLIFLNVVMSLLILQQLPAMVLWLRRVTVAAVRSGAAMLASWAKAAAPFLLIAALITGIILVIDDLVTSVEGGNSVLDGLIERMRDAGGATAALAETLQFLFGGGLGNWLYDVFEWLADVPDQIAEAFTKSFDKLKNKFSAVFDFFGGSAEGASSGLSSASPALAGSSPGKTNNIQVGGSSVNVSVNGAGNPQAVGAAVAQQTDAVLSDHATRVARNLSATMAY